MSSVSSSVTPFEVDCKKQWLIIFNLRRGCIVCAWKRLGFQTHHGTGQVHVHETSVKSIGLLASLEVVQLKVPTFRSEKGWKVWKNFFKKYVWMTQNIHYLIQVSKFTHWGFISRTQDHNSDLDITLEKIDTANKTYIY